MRRLFTALLFLLASPMVALAAPAGEILRIKGMAKADQRALVPGVPIDEKEIISTGPDGRLEIRLTDGTRVVMGENGRLTVDRFLPDREARLKVEAGSFLIETGSIAKLAGRPFLVATPVAVIGVRGTRFWGGAMDTPLDVLLLDGAISVETDGGSVDLTKPFQGTSVPTPGGPPDAPGIWGQKRIDRAFATVSFE